MKRRFILIHYHLFKNAGTTVDWILNRNFGDKLLTFHEEGETGVVANSELVQLAKQNPHAQAFTSHHFRLPAPKHERFRFLEVCFLRHPLDRLQSMYCHYRRMEDPVEAAAVKARQSSLPEFITWMCGAQPYSTVNAQTALLGNRGRYFFPPSPAHLRKAIVRMRNLAVLGVVERFDDSLIAAEHFLGRLFPNLDLSYLAQNVNPSRPATLVQQLEMMRDECGPTLYAKIEQLNALDLELVAAGEAELDRRVQFIPEFAAKRADFQARCAALRPRSLAEGA